MDSARESVFGRWLLHKANHQESTLPALHMAGKVAAFFTLMRPKNVVLASATVPLGAYFALMGTNVEMPWIVIACHTLAVLSFTGAGNAMNDLKDAEIDIVAHPFRPLPSGQLTISQAQWFTVLLWLGSVFAHITGVMLYDTDMEIIVPTVLIYILAVVLMVTYDHGVMTKNKGLFGNIVISVLVGAVILYGAAAVGGLMRGFIWWIFGVVFFSNLARELVKDCMDMEADAATRQTLPMQWGKERVRMFAYVLLMGALICLYLPFWRGPFQFGQLLLQTPAILLLITLNGPLFAGKDALVASRIRIAMLLGLLSFIVASVL